MTDEMSQLFTLYVRESLHSRLKRGLEKHHFFRMVEKNRFSDDKTNFECVCGAEFEEPEELRDHQELSLRIFLGIPELREDRASATKGE